MTAPYHGRIRIDAGQCADLSLGGIGVLAEVPRGWILLGVSVLIPRAQFAEKKTMRALLTASLVVAGTLASGSVPALAGGFDSGNDLLDDCSAKSGDNPVKAGACLGYVTGVADVLGGGTVIDGIRACFVTATTGQLKDVVLRYLNEHPETRHLVAASLVARALSEAFPCPKK
jgi:hypothetical protein